MLCDPLVSPADRTRRIDQEGHDIHIGKLCQGDLVELLAEGILRLVEARGIDDDELAAGAVDDSTHALPRRLGDRRGDSDLLAHAGIEKRRLADRRPAD